MLWKAKMASLDLLFPGLRGFFHPLVKVVEKRSAGPGIPCGGTCSCRALSAPPSAAQAAVTPDANHTYTISGFARLQGRRKDEG